MTLKEIQALSNLDLRTKVAEIHGWKRDDRFLLCTDEHLSVGWIHPSNGGWYGAGGDSPLPNYPEDLNAMLKAEESLTADEWSKYRATLATICDKDIMVRAKAIQRAQAFVLAKEN